MLLNRKTLAAALALAAMGSSVGVAAQSVSNEFIVTQASGSMVALHPAVALSAGDSVVGSLAFSQPIHVVLPLKLRNEQQLDKYIGTPGFKPLTSAQFNVLYGPTAEQAQSVANYLTKAGFTNVRIAANNGLVEADGRADTAQAAFNTSFVRVKTHDGRDAYANNSPVQIPASLQGMVHAVLGLQNVHVSKVSARHYEPALAQVQATNPMVNGVSIGHKPSDFRAIYGAGTFPDVTAVPVGSISAGPMGNVLNDLKAVHPEVAVTVKGYVDTSTAYNANDFEWDLDSQVIIPFTGVKQYYFYNAASLSESDLQRAFAQVVSDNLLKVIDVSLGLCESTAYYSGFAAASDTVFKQAVAQGQTFFVSTGDSGADECGTGGTTPSWPATSQYVTAVGGTQLYTTGSTTWASEVVWNDNTGATGGSSSTFEPIPSWQVGIRGVPNQTYRGVPDIAFAASPYSGALVTVDGVPNQQWGGTSLAAPIAVGFWAHELQHFGTDVGFAAPVIYTLGKSVDSPNIFNDITSGNNGGENAAPGWDYTSGWGSVNFNRFSLSSPFPSSGGGVAIGTGSESNTGSTTSTVQPIATTAHLTFVSGVTGAQVLDVPGANYTSGTSLNAWASNGGQNQNWTLTLVPGLNGVFTMQPTGAPSLCLQYNGGGSNATIATCNGQPSQQFYAAQSTQLSKNFGAGYPAEMAYQIRSYAAPTNCLNVAGSSTANGAQMLWWGCNVLDGTTGINDFWAPWPDNGVGPVNGYASMDTMVLAQWSVLFNVYGR